MSKVYEGNAELDISKFIAGLKDMEAAVEKTATKISAAFQALDQNIQNALGGFQGQVQAASQTLTQVGNALASANGAVTQSGQQLQQASKTQQDQALKQSQDFAKQVVANEKKLQSDLVAEMRARVKAQADAAKLSLDQMRTDGQRELAALKQRNSDIERVRQADASTSLRQLKDADAAQAKEIEEAYAKQRQIIEEAINEQRRLQQVALQTAAAAKQAQATMIQDGKPDQAAGAARAYEASIQAAKLAAEQHASLERQRTQVTRVEAKARQDATVKAAQEAAASEVAAARAGQASFKTVFKQAVQDAKDDLEKVENAWNSIYRAGSQLASLGTRLTAFAGGMTALGGKLTQNAGDFDFWARRVVASSQAAGLALQNGDGSVKNAQQLIETFSDSILKLGRDLGTLSPEEVGQSWYLYQAAVGTAITSNEDLIRSQEAVGTILKAAVVSDTNYETAIRGVTQAMAEFKLGAEDTAHATSVMLNLTQTSQAEFGDVLESFKMVGPQASRLGISLEQTSSILSRLSDNGIRGSAAGRALSQVLTTIIDPSDKAADALQDLLVKQQGLTGSWRDIVFKGGEFVGMLDKVNAATGETTKGFLHIIADATKNMTEAERQYYIAAVFSQNAMRSMIPLVGEYTDKIAGQADAVADGKQSMEEMQKAFEDTQKQASLFNDQWGFVAEGIKVRLGQATFSLREAFIRLGFVVAETFLPIVEWVSRAITKFVEWGNTHPALIRGLVTLMALVTGAAAVFGPLLFILGNLIQTVAGIPVALQAVRSALSVVGVSSTALGASLGAIAGPILIVIAVLGLLYLAWKTNFLGMGEILGKFFGILGSEFSALGDMLEGVFQLIGGLISGNSEQVAAALDALGVAFMEAFIVLPNKLAGVLQEAANSIQSWASETFSWLVDSLAVWGNNLMISLANGIIEGSNAVGEAVWGVAEYIASFFRSYSPPKHGPLTGIHTWGRNLIGTFVEGMNAADISAISDIAGRIGDALKTNIEAGNADAGIYAQTMMLANEKVAEMIEVVKGGGRVTAEFFEPLRDGLGEWYDDVVRIAVAYQDMYALQSQLSAERERLDLIKQQRKELDAANQARQDAFDVYLGKSDASSYLNNQGEMVDPTTEEGKARIEQMRQSLSKEDFQNWINFQKKLWDQKTAAEDKTLSTQEDAAQTAVNAYEKQLAVVKEQYDYFVKMYEYAQRLNDLAKEQQQLEDQKDKAKGATSTVGTPEDLDKARADIAGIVGSDGVISDEGTLSAQHGGDDVAGLAAAQRQREQEENRLSNLEKENRKKRAEFESQLIAATSDEERNRVKQQKDAWDAAYKEEKARLQERIGFAKEVEDAAEQRADSSKAAREAAIEAGYQADLSKILGDQAGQIADANALKEKAGSLDGAQVAATGQLRDEERKLNDLRALGDQKRLEFEQRLREAAGDPEKMRHIKEEQEAWETAYKKALEVQQARAEAARRAKQDLGDEDTANGPDRSGPKGFQAPNFPDAAAGGLPEIQKPDWMNNPPAWLSQGPPKPLEAPRETQIQASQWWNDLKIGIDFLNNKSIDTKTKLSLLGDAVKEALGWKTWWDALAPEQTRERIKAGWLRVIGGISDTWSGIKASWDGFWATMNARWEGFKAGVSDSWNGFWSGVSSRWEVFKSAFITGWNKYWDETLKPVYAFVGFVYVLWVTMKDLWGQLVKWFTENVSTPFTKAWNDFWTGIQSWWTENVSTPFKAAWNEFWTGVFSWWNTNIKEPFKAGWEAFWSGLRKWWDENVAAPFSKAWNEFWTVALQKWDEFKKNVSTAWNQFWTDLTTAWTTFKRDVSEQWNAFWKALRDTWDGVKKWWEESILPLFGQLKAKWDEAIKPLTEGWNDFINKVDTVFSKITGFFSSLETTINRLISIGKKLVNLDFSGGGSGGETDGSNAGGLYKVPFDGYRSELHKGERVLTNAEATVYNRIEKLGVLGVLEALSNGASARIAQATAPQTVIQNQTVVHEGDRKEVNVNVARIDASNPDEGRAFVQRVSYLMP